MGAPSAGTANPYQGEDRRRVAGPVAPPHGRPYVVALLLIVITWMTVTFVAQVPAAWLESSGLLVNLLQMASFMVLVAVAALAFSRWYLVSDAPALWVGTALMVFAIGRLALAELVPLVTTNESVAAALTWVRPAAQITVIVLLIRATTMVPVSVSMSGPRLMLASVLGVAGLATLLAFVPPVAAVIDGAPQSAPRVYGSVNDIAFIGVAYTALAAAFTWKGYRRRRWLFVWLGLFLLCASLGDITRVTAPGGVNGGLLGQEIMRLLGALLALVGATREILYTYRDHSTRLAQSEFTAISAEERIRAGQAAAEERAHEARSALAAIEGATRTLEHYRDRLPPDTQAALSQAVSGEIRRLQRLVSVEQANSEKVAFSVAESVAPIVATERARGVSVDVRVPGDLNVVGHAAATEQVIQSLFDNARRYAPGSPVTVRAERAGEHVVLRVEDRGPGVAPEQREAIFRRGVRGDSALEVPGSGLGLFVAANLVRDQDGELWVDDRDGGGASFALALPAADEGLPQEPVEGLQQGREAVQERGFRTVPGRD